MRTQSTRAELLEKAEAAATSRQFHLAFSGPINNTSSQQSTSSVTATTPTTNQRTTAVGSSIAYQDIFNNDETSNPVEELNTEPQDNLQNTLISLGIMVGILAIVFVFMSYTYNRQKHQEQRRRRSGGGGVGNGGVTVADGGKKDGRLLLPPSATSQNPKCSSTSYVINNKYAAASVSGSLCPNNHRNNKNKKLKVKRISLHRDSDTDM